MSDTRPPITAGPIERAFRFLKSASLSGTGEGEALGVAEGDGVSCADKIEIAKLETTKVQQKTIRVVMTGLSSRFIFVEQALRWVGRANASRAGCATPNRCNVVILLILNHL